MTRPCAASPSGPARSLEARVQELFAAELARYTDLLDSLALDPETPEQLRRASRRVEDARYAGQRRD